MTWAGPVPVHFADGHGETVSPVCGDWRGCSTWTRARAATSCPWCLAVLTSEDEKVAHILAKSLFKELRMSGYSPNQILGVSTELIDLVTKELHRAHESSPHQLVGANDAEPAASSAGVWMAQAQESAPP